MSTIKAAPLSTLPFQEDKHYMVEYYEGFYQPLMAVDSFSSELHYGLVLLFTKRTRHENIAEYDYQT